MGNKRDGWEPMVIATTKTIKHRFAERMKILAAKTPEVRNEERRRHLVTQRSISPSDFTSRLNFRDHGDLLELEWPGCSVMWDAHPEIRQWHHYCLMVVENYMAKRPYSSRYTRVHELGHRKHKKQRDRMLEEARVHGPLILVAYMLHVPQQKPAQIAVEWCEPPNQISMNLTWTPVRAIYTASELRWTLVR